MTQNTTKQLSDLKEGDKVFVKDCCYPGDFIDTIKRVTKTQIITSNDNKFRRKDGCEVGAGQWYRYRSHITPATPELIAQVKRKDEIILARRNAHDLTVKLEVMCRDSDNAAAAISHLEAALAALKDHPAP